MEVQHLQLTGLCLSIVRVLPAAALGMLLLGLALCFWLSWRGAKRLETVANGLEALAQGQTVRLSTDGFAGELAEKLNRTGAQLQAKMRCFPGGTRPHPVDRRSQS